MNCIKHNDVVAVGSCGKCNVGLCTECINDAVRDDDNKPMCQKCTLDVVIDPHIAYLQKTIDNIKQKRIIWSILLVVGAVFVGYGLLSDSLAEYIGFLVWGCAGFTERASTGNQSLEKSLENAHYNAVARHRIESGDPAAIGAAGGKVLGTIMGKTFVWIMRGVFFPIVYLIFMLTGVKKLKKELADMQEARDILVSKM